MGSEQSLKPPSCGDLMNDNFSLTFIYTDHYQKKISTFKMQMQKTA
jgi:hypothetical protein